MARTVQMISVHGKSTREKSMMEQTWTTKQVVTFLMAMATGLHFSAGLNQNTSFHAIDKLLASCVEQEHGMVTETRHLEAFQESLQPGFFEEANVNIVDTKNRSQGFHQDMMQLSDDSFLTLVANLSQPTMQKIKMRQDLHRLPHKGL